MKIQCAFSPDAVFTISRELSLFNPQELEPTIQNFSICAVYKRTCSYHCWCAGIRDIVLFRRFVPENGGEYFGAIVFCIAMGLIASAVRVYRGTLEAAERVERTKV